jgi:hypothetical protein
MSLGKIAYQTATVPFDHHWTLSGRDVFGHEDVHFYFIVAYFFV